MYNSKFYTSKCVAISIFMGKKLKFAFSLEYVSLYKKNNYSLLLFLNKCKLLVLSVKIANKMKGNLYDYLNNEHDNLHFDNE
jgi:hypothetical protein